MKSFEPLFEVEIRCHFDDHDDAYKTLPFLRSCLRQELKQIKLAGTQVLFQHLGATGMVRFLQQFHTGWGDYTTERHTWLDQDEDVQSLAEKIIAQRKE